MADTTADRLKAHLSMFKAKHPIQKGYIARLMIVEGRSARGMLSEIRSILQAAEPGKQLHERSFSTNAYALKRLILAKSQQLTEEWPTIVRLLLQPFPITFRKLSEKPASPQPECEPCLTHSQSVELLQTSVCKTNNMHPSEVTFGKTGCHQNGEVSIVEVITLDSDTCTVFCDYVSSLGQNHNTYTSTDVEENRTVAYSSQSSLTVPDSVLSGRASNLQVTDSKNMAEDVCYAEDVRSGEEKNKQTHTEPVESVIIIDLPAMMTDVSDCCHENSEDVHQECNKPSDLQVITLENMAEDLCYTLDRRLGEDQNNQTHKEVIESVVFIDLPGMTASVNDFRNDYSEDVQQNRNIPSDLQVIDLTNMDADICYTLDPESGENRNRQTQTETIESIIVIDIPAMMANAKDSHSEFSEDVLLEHNKLLQQELPSCEKTPQCQKKAANIDHCSGENLDKILVNKWKTKSLASQSSGQPSALRYEATSVLQHDQLCVLQSAQPSVLRSVQPSVSQSVQPSILWPSQPSVLQPDHPSVLQSDPPSVFQSDHSSFLRSDQPSVQQSDQPSILQWEHQSVLQSDDLSVLRSDQSSVLQSSQSSASQFSNHGFEQNNNIKEHIQAPLKPFKCGICGSRFILQHHLKRHLLFTHSPKKRSHNTGQVYKCDLCEQEFEEHNDLQKHNWIHTGHMPYKCDICGNAFKKHSLLQHHKKSHTGVYRYKCEVCGRELKSRMSFEQHMQIHTGEKQYKCDVCDRRYASAKYLKVHKRNHTKDKQRYKCEICGSQFTYRKLLETHVFNHSKTKPYQCDVCGVTFALSGYLRKHKKIHSRQPCKCGVCGLEFPQTRDLRKHKKVHSTKEMYKCDVCGCELRSLYALELHSRKHKGEKPFICDTCGKRFILKFHLKVHKRMHTAQKPYKCDVCEASFVRPSSLKTHKTKHTGKC